MAWTAPRTWVAGEVVSAAIMNAHVRDNLLAIGGVRTVFTSTWTGSTTNPAIGNGTFVSRYLSAGKLLAVSMALTSGSTTTYGSGFWTFTTPVTLLNATVPVNSTITTVDVLPSTVITHGFVRPLTATTIVLDTTAASPYSSAVPQTWATGDSFAVEYAGEAA